MVDLPDPADDILQPAGLQEQRVAPGEQGVRDLRVVPDVEEPLGDVLLHLPGIPDEEALAETVAAETPADVAHEQQSRFTIFMLQPRRPGIPVF